MKHVIATVFSLSALLAGTAIVRADVAQDVVEQLGAQGYTQIQTERSLWRWRIQAHRGDEIREIVLSERTGEVLRDASRNFDGEDARRHRAGDGADRDDAGTTDRDRDRDRDRDLDGDHEPDRDQTRDRDRDHDGSAEDDTETES